MNKISEFVGSVKQEIKKISWPEKQAIVDSTIVVFVSLFFISAVVAAIDFCFFKIITFIRL